MERWYVANSQPRAEGLALANLANQGFCAYLPRYWKLRRHARRTERVPAPLFPGYLFVRMDVGRVRWRAIHSTVGVRHLVCNGLMPTPVPPGIVEDIRGREDADGFVAMDQGPPFAKGEVVRILAGALCDQVGLFDCASDDDRVVILLDLLGRQVKVRVPLEAVGTFA